MKMEFIKIGDELDTADGFIRIAARHGEDFWVEDFEPDEDCIVYDKVGERLLTRHDLNRIVKDADGQNHNFWWGD